MRVSRDQAAASKVRITREAARLMRKNGIDGTSVADVMMAAGMTTGGFYKHFASKEDLTAAAVREAFDEVLGHVEREGQKKGPAAAAKSYFENYLSAGHIRNPGSGCPVASMGSDAGRENLVLGSQYQHGVERTLDLLSGGTLSKQDRLKLIQKMAMLVGTVILARAVGDCDLREEILSAARRNP